MKKKAKKILVISDLHCGSEVGLTMPHWSYRKIKEDTENHNAFATLQTSSWQWFAKNVKKLGKIDMVFCIGDLVDGCNEKEAAVGLISSNMEKQSQMAIDILEYIGAKKHFFVHGSNYHVSRIGIEFENNIASYFNGKIDIQQFVDVNGLVFGLKHHQGRSSIPHGRGTLLHKGKLWEQMWKDYKDYPTSDIMLRGHTHYAYAIQDSKYLMLSLPCLKNIGEKFGKYFQSVVDYGFTSFEVESKTDWNWKFNIANFSESKPRVSRA